jgi:8-hydroxy-5-deazaflavin:NADPH oxidoreductase
MNTKQTVVLIGASAEMDAAIARNISKGNYRILLYSTDSFTAQAVANNIKTGNPSADIEVADEALDACWEADIIIVAVPYQAEKKITDDIRKVTNQKIVISVSNPVNSSATGLLTENTSAAEELQKLLPNAKVIKAFNNTSASDFDQPFIDGQQMDCFIAGNDENALEVVYDLVKTAGFNPVVAGDLSASRTLESMQFLLMQLGMQKSSRWRGGWKMLHN